MACQLAARETRYLLQVQLQLSGVPLPHFKHVNSIWIDSSYDVVHRVQLYFCLSCHSNLEKKKGEAHEMMPSHKHPSRRRSYLLLGYLTGMIRLLRFACVKFCFNVGGFFRAPVQFLTSKGTTTCICLKQQLYPFLHATKSRFTVRSMIFSGNQSKRPVQQKFVILNLHCYTMFFECGEPSWTKFCNLLFSIIFKSDCRFLLPELDWISRWSGFGCVPGSKKQNVQQMRHDSLGFRRQGSHFDRWIGHGMWLDVINLDVLLIFSWYIWHTLCFSF